uniref:Uncharacterized protein n=1 Tax=Lactuca sativa TaxID=4236 RepID=A0A9R1UN68_LACSA|nr:hypothetical protein LSAT_V11C800430140 [Lactuca sativa]
MTNIGNVRAKCLTNALVSSWKRGDIMPFVWDLLNLVNSLTKRDDIDHFRIGIVGISLERMHAWFAAFVDIHYLAMIDLEIGANDKEVVEKLSSIKIAKCLDDIAPGLASKFNSLCMVRLITPCPLLIINAKKTNRRNKGSGEGRVAEKVDFHGVDHLVEREEQVIGDILFGCSDDVMRVVLKEACRRFKRVSIETKEIWEKRSHVDDIRFTLHVDIFQWSLIHVTMENVWDLLNLVNSLTKRDDIDHSKIGIVGISLEVCENLSLAFAKFRAKVNPMLVSNLFYKT